MRLDFSAMFRRKQQGPSFGFLDFKPDSTPSPLYPEENIPAPHAPSEKERQIVAQFLTVRESIRDGPFFTGSTATRGRVAVEVENSINDGIKRYTDRYIKKRKIGASVEDHPYVLEFFPRDLHTAMGVSSRKKIDIAKFSSTLTDLKGADASFKEKLAQAENNNDDDDDNDEDEVEDDHYSDEEEENDYNAEQYFSDGADSGGDEDDGGGATY